MTEKRARLDVTITGILPATPGLLWGADLAQAVWELVTEMGLEQDKATKLFRAAMALHGWQRMPKMLAADRGDAEPHQAMADIAEATAALCAQLDKADQGSQSSLGIAFADRSTSFAQFRQDLSFLEERATALAERQKRGVGRPRDTATRCTLSMLLLRVEEATGKQVRGATMRKALSDRHLTGAGGKFITAWFRLVDPTITETALFHLVKEVRAERAADPDELSRRKKNLELCELFAFAHVNPY